MSSTSTDALDMFVRESSVRKRIPLDVSTIQHRYRVEHANAPFVTGIKMKPLTFKSNHGRSEPQVFNEDEDLPENIDIKTPPLPQGLDITNLIKAALKTQQFRRERHDGKCVSYIESDLSILLIRDTLWWSICSFLRDQKDRNIYINVLTCIHKRIAINFAQLFMRIDSTHKDMFCNIYPHALSHCVYDVICQCFKTLRRHILCDLREKIIRAVSEWMYGSVHSPNVTRQYSDAKTAFSGVNGVNNETRNLWYDDKMTQYTSGKAKNELMAFEDRRKETTTQLDWQNQFIATVTSRRRKRLGNSNLVLDYLNLRPDLVLNPSIFAFETRITEGPKEDQPIMDKLFMYHSINRKIHHKNRELSDQLKHCREQINQQHRASMKACFDERKKLAKQKSEAIRSSRKFVVRVLESLKHDKESNLAVNVVGRTISDAIRTEQRLGPAPVFYQNSI